MLCVYLWTFCLSSKASWGFQMEQWTARSQDKSLKGGIITWMEIEDPADRWVDLQNFKAVI